MTARIMAAVPGNYVLTALLTACIARLLPAPPADASMTALLLSFLIFPALAIAIFSVRSVVRIWIYIGAAIAAFSVLLFVSLSAGGRL
ncbi:MAG: hypothetical protein AAGC95_15795 [Pseudomonadota bacterium]